MTSASPRRALREAILSAFPQAANLRQTLAEAAPPRNFDAHVSIAEDYSAQLFQLIDNATAEGWLPELLDALRAARPQNAAFVAVVDRVAARLRAGKGLDDVPSPPLVEPVVEPIVAEEKSAPPSPGDLPKTSSPFARSALAVTIAMAVLSVAWWLFDVPARKLQLMAQCKSFTTADPISMNIGGVVAVEARGFTLSLARANNLSIDGDNAPTFDNTGGEYVFSSVGSLPPAVALKPEPQANLGPSIVTFDGVAKVAAKEGPSSALGLIAVAAPSVFARFEADQFRVETHRLVLQGVNEFPRDSVLLVQNDVQMVDVRLQSIEDEGTGAEIDATTFLRRPVSVQSLSGRQPISSLIVEDCGSVGVVLDGKEVDDLPSMPSVDIAINASELRFDELDLNELAEGTTILRISVSGTAYGIDYQGRQLSPNRLGMLFGPAIAHTTILGSLLLIALWLAKEFVSTIFLALASRVFGQRWGGH